MKGKLGLTINREKTRVVRLNEEGANLDFLGYSFHFHRDLKGRGHRYLRIEPSTKAMARERDRIRELTDHHHCFQPLPEMIKAINRQTTGWKNYFNLGHPRKAMRQINHFITERLIGHSQRRSQRPMKLKPECGYQETFKRLGLKYL
ncbi:MAG: maturase [Acidobacteriota bacterium]|nr:MAG: maturase [Acidobacteriota bacterium]